MRLTNANINEVLNQKQYTVKYGLGSQYVAEQKLGQLEDIEEELGIDLITFFKIFEGQDVYIKLNNGEIIEGFSPTIEENLYGIYFTVDGKYANTIADYGSYYVNIKDYGKTWALTKEELV